MSKTIEDLQLILKQNNNKIENVKVKSAFVDYHLESIKIGMICDIINCYQSTFDYNYFILTLDFEPYSQNEDNDDDNCFDLANYSKKIKKVYFHNNIHSGLDFDLIFEFPEIKSEVKSKEKIYKFTFYKDQSIEVKAEDENKAKVEFTNILIDQGYIVMYPLN